MKGKQKKAFLHSRQNWIWNQLGAARGNVYDVKLL